MSAHTTAPKQQRSRETEQRLLAAAEELIAERGLAGLSIAELVRRAHSSVGSFYGRFGDKDGLLRALHTRRMDTILAQLHEMHQSGILAQLDRGTAMTLCMTELVRHYQDHAHLMAAFNARSAEDPVKWSETIETHRNLVQTLAQLLAQSDGNALHPRANLALELGLHMVFALLGDWVVYGTLPNQQLPFSMEELPQELARLLLGYLNSEEP